MNAKLCALAVLVAASSCVTTAADVATAPGMSLAVELERSDYVILGNATGEACAEERCWFFTSCTKKAEISGQEILEGRMESSSLRDANGQRTDGNPLAFLSGLFGQNRAQGPSGSQLAEKIALHQALQSMPNADAIIAPRKTIDITKSSVLGLQTTTKSCVKVVGKAIHIKTDAELAAARAR